MKNNWISTFLFIIGVLLPISFLNAQTSLREIDLQNGKYQVGFKHYISLDSTRTYRIKNEFNHRYLHRLIPISIWYPAIIDTSLSKELAVLDYLEILKEEEEWANLPNEYLLDWFPYLWNTPQNEAHLTEKVKAFSSITMLNDKFPAVVYAPSYQASSIENFALFEYLASHGYIVISSPSRGNETRWLEGGTTKDMETQSRDVEFLLKALHQFENINQNQLALMGFSFGGLANALTVMKNKQVRAVVSLDGTERYNYPVLEKSPYFDLNNFDVPYIHFAQKDIPSEVLLSEQIPAKLNVEFPLYDSLKYSHAYRFKFHDLTHSYFSTFGVLFANRDQRQDKSDDKIMTSYKLLCEHTLQFLNATLKNDKTAKAFIDNSPVENGFSEALISKREKKPLKKAFDYRDFNDLAVQQGYKGLISLYQKMVVKYPYLSLEEGMLNTLGLRLAFNPAKAEQGIEVLSLALYLYPESANLYDSLATAFVYKNDVKNAILNFEKSLALNPENEHAIQHLKRLRE